MAILVEALNPDVAGRERWTNYHQVVYEASPEFTGSKTRSDDPCLVYFTSGTVGYPKMVLHTQASYPIGHTITTKYWLNLHWNLSEMGWANCQNRYSVALPPPQTQLILPSTANAIRTIATFSRFTHQLHSHVPIRYYIQVFYRHVLRYGIECIDSSMHT